MKKLVNDYELYNQFLQYIEEKIELARKNLELKIDPHDIYRLQGEIMALRRLLMTREDINGRKQ